jgi:uncharacterized caspase-like protein
MNRLSPAGPHPFAVPLLAVAAFALAHPSPAGAQPPGGPAPPQGQRLALIVGVNEYHPRSELRNLKFARRDAEELAAALRAAGYREQNVILMTNPGAPNGSLLPNSANLREELETLLGRCQPGDTLLVALAGHGVQFRGDPEAYFCPADARLDPAKRNTLIPLGEVYAQLEKCKASARVLLVDACRNDPLADNSRSAANRPLASETRPELPTPPGGVVALFSCSKGEKAFEDEQLRHGVFFHCVIEGLKSKKTRNGRGEVTFSALSDYVAQEVPGFAQKYGRQTPEQKAALRGSIVLATPADEKGVKKDVKRDDRGGENPQPALALEETFANGVPPGWAKSNLFMYFKDPPRVEATANNQLHTLTTPPLSLKGDCFLEVEFEGHDSEAVVELLLRANGRWVPVAKAHGDTHGSVDYVLLNAKSNKKIAVEGQAGRLRLVLERRGNEYTLLANGKEVLKYPDRGAVELTGLTVAGTLQHVGNNIHIRVFSVKAGLLPPPPNP